MIKKLFLFFFVLFLVACSESGGVSSANNKIRTENDSLAGMLLVHANNSVASLGTNDAKANVNERPEMKVTMDYDFSIGKHEVTCGEFNSLMKPLTGLELECSSDKIPATNLTFYDAVLYANERSKAEGFLDTAYTYTSAEFDEKKRCTNLEGFVFHPEVDAYRLPTEAEWSLVALKYWKTSEAWTSENSDFKLHEVCSKTDSSQSVCDIVGNAMEWVNDWLGYFCDQPVKNFIGPPDGGSNDERVLKGGSYHSKADVIKLYNRGDTYMVTSATKADYVGFRLAFGAIPNAEWMGKDCKAITSRVSPLANSAALRSKTGTFHVKLAFRNNPMGNIAFIDYSSGMLSVNEISDSLDAYHPEISPDGQKVAFCTRYEGVSSYNKSTKAYSALYVRDLKESGSGLVKLDVESAEIPRWRVLENGDTVIVYVTDADDNTEESSFKKASTWQVKFSNGKFGNPQKLFDGAYHGGISEDDRLAVSGSKQLRARIAAKGSNLSGKAVDTVWYKNGKNAEQACNVSIAKDGSKRTLFLDFGGKIGQEFVGENYGTHQRLLIADSTGKLIQSVEAPSGYAFDHTEWVSGASDLIVATLTNADYAHGKIVLVNLSDSSIVDLAEGDELWHPSLWVKKIAPSSGDDKLNLDSACAYMTEKMNIYTRIMKVKMDYFWQYRDSAEVVIIGSSRSFSGVDPEYIKSGFAINMSYSAQDLMSTNFFVKNYILPLMPKLKTIVLALDYDRWYVKDENWIDWFSNIPGYEYDKNHNYWQDGFIGDMVAASQAALNPNEDEYELFGYHRGMYKSTTVGWGSDIPPIDYDPQWFEIDESGFNYNLQKLSEILELARNFDVNVVGVIYPQSPNYTKTMAWGRYGPTRDAVEIIKQSVQKLVDKYPNFKVLDEYKDGNHDYAEGEFANEDHLGLEGSKVITARIDSLLKTLK